MSRFEVQLQIAATVDEVFAMMTDPARMPRWLPYTEAIEDATGPIREAGTTFRQRAARGLRRPGATVSADPPWRWHLRLVGGGERVDATFDLSVEGGSTHVKLEAQVKNGPWALGPIVDRLSWRFDRRIWSRALVNLKEELERAPVVPTVGTVYSLETGGGIFRIGQILEADQHHVHLRLYCAAIHGAARSGPNRCTGIRTAEASC